jgi:PAS domain S-box-containing protein
MVDDAERRQLNVAALDIAINFQSVSKPPREGWKRDGTRAQRFAMWNSLRRWLNKVPIEHSIERRQTSLFQLMLIGLLIATVITIPLALAAPVASNTRMISLGASSLLGLHTLGALVLLRSRRFQLSVATAIAGLMLADTLLLLHAGLFMGGVALLGLVAPITLASFLIGRRGVYISSGLSIAIVVIIGMLQYVSPPLAESNMAQGDIISTAVIVFILTIGLLGFILDRFGAALRGALNDTLIREQELEHNRAALQVRTIELEREVAERRRVEAALRESEELYRLIAEHTSDLIGLYDLNDSMRRVYASPSYHSMLGYQPDDLIKLAPSDLLHPEDLPAVAAYQQRLYANGAATATYRLRHAVGSWVWVDSRSTIVTHEGQLYALTVARDVSERKHLEAQLMQSQRLESVGRLAGGVAHDFNNLLTAIMGNTDLARDSLAASHPARADMDEIMKSSQRAAELTRQLLAFARKQIIEPHVIDLSQLILDMDKLLRRLIGEHIDLILLADPGLWHVRADRGQIEQIVVNLALNARDAMPEGGTLTIETRNVQLDHDYAHRHISISPGCYVMLAVSDVGTGMDEATQAQIFEPFFTTKPQGRGTGLGLATCYGIVKQHGGSIWPYSEPGHGSTFKIYLPRVEAPTEERPMPAAGDDMPRGSETVLLAEDEPSVRMLAARVLRAQGYTVVEAENGDAALQLAHAWAGSPIDLLLTDVIMPRMSGKTLAERIQLLYPACDVLFISGYTDNTIVHHGQLDPGVVFLQKPFSPAALARKVRAMLDARRLSK